MMRVRVMVTAVMLACGSGVGFAQMGMDAGSTAAIGSPVAPAQAEDAMLSMFQHELTAVVEAMPADKFNFAPSSSAIAGSKYEGVRTFAQEVTHLIGANYYFYGQVSGTKPPIEMSSLKNMTDKAQIVQALAASFVFAHQAVATITPANAFLAIKPVDGVNTRATLASFAVAHGFDHYGQLVEYLRMNGVVPPGSK